MPPPTSPQLAPADLSTIQAWAGGGSSSSSGTDTSGAASVAANPCPPANGSANVSSDGSADGSDAGGTIAGTDTSGGVDTSTIGAVATGSTSTDPTGGIIGTAGTPNGPVPVPTVPATTGTTGASGIPASIGADRTLANTLAPNLLGELYSERATNSGYRAWTQQQRIVYVQGLGIYARTFWNLTLVQALQANSAVMPVGAISVLEAYADVAATQFKGWYVLGKGTPASDPTGWFTYQLTGTPSAAGVPVLPAAPQVYDMGDATCSGCHQSAAYPTYVIGAPF
jgi:hypothetical protein